MQTLGNGPYRVEEYVEVLLDGKWFEGIVEEIGHFCDYKVQGYKVAIPCIHTRMGRLVKYVAFSLADHMIRPLMRKHD